MTEENFNQNLDTSSNNDTDNGSLNYDNNSNNYQSNQEFSIPDEYKDRGWTKFFDGKSGDELKQEFFKSYDNSQSLIGKKVEDLLATTELKQLNNYEDIKKNLTAQLAPEYNVPENPSDYNLNSFLQDENGNQIYTITEGSVEHFEQKFKELGLTKEQGTNLMKEYMDYQFEEFQKYTDADDLEKNVSAMFKGNTEQRTKCESLIKEHLNADDLKFIQDTMPNPVIEMFYKIAKGMVEKYDYKEGNSASTQSTMRKTQAEKDNEYLKIVNELEALSHRPHTTQEKHALLQQLNNIY